MEGLGKTAALHIGVVGVGRIGSLHAASLQALEGVERLTLTDADAGRAGRPPTELGRASPGTPEELVRSRRRRLVIATPRPRTAALLRLCRATPACRRSARNRRARGARARRRGRVHRPGGHPRADRVPAGASTPASGRRVRPWRPARSGTCSSSAPRRTTRARLPRPTSPSPEASTATSTSMTSMRSGSSRATRSSRSTRQARSAKRPGSSGTTTSTPRLPVLRLSGGALAVLTGTRHDPLGYDVRLEVFGTSDSIVAGSDARTPLRSVEPGSPPAPAGYPSFHGALRARLPD